MSSLMACIAGMALDAIFGDPGTALPPGTDHWKLDFDTGKVAARIFVKMMRKKKESQDVFYGLVW